MLGYRGLFSVPPFDDKVLPIGTSSINEATLTGGAVTSSIDTTVTFAAKPTTKIAVTSGGTSAFIQVGVNAASINLDVGAQNILNRRIIVLAKTDGANTLDQFLLYLGDGTYANFRTFGETQSDASGTWTVYERFKLGADTTTGTPPALNLLQRSRVRIYCKANVVPGNIWIGYVGVLPPAKPSVVFTCDDGYSEWDWLATEAAARRVPISLGIISSQVGDAGYLTEAQILSMAQSPYVCFTNHASSNASYVDLGLTDYVASIETCRDYLVGLGLDPYAASIHQYSHGDYDNTLIAALKSRGYHSCRTVGPTTGQAAQHGLIGLKCDNALHNIRSAASLDVAYNLATVQSYISNAASTGTAFIMGHRFGASAGAITWIKGYDANYGVLNLLDWLADKRDNEGWQLYRWSDWTRRVQAGRPAAVGV